MALTTTELKQTEEYAQKARQGDMMAVNFFATLKSQGTSRSKEFLDAKSAFDAEANSGLSVDPQMGESLGLNSTQVKDCKEATIRYFKKDRQAVAFFAACEHGAAAGSTASAGMLTLRDEILKTLNGLPKEKREALLTGTSKEETKDTTSLDSETAVAVQSGTNAPPVSTLTVAGVVTTMPATLDEAHLTVIRSAIDANYLFTAAAVRPLVDALEDAVKFIDSTHKAPTQTELPLDITPTKP